MSFSRQVAMGWSREVPGARWFKADLHLHTVDDHAGGRPRWPPGLAGNPEDPEVLRRYARTFLKEVIRAGIHVVGLTPHSPRAGGGAETSAVWHIVETWNGGDDDDGTPFREKIFAVFPGFEPSFKDGKEGLHLLFLFDPEIGRESYLRIFDVLMGGVEPWREGRLQIAGRSASEAFKALEDFRARECSPDSGQRPHWDSLVLAPHIDSPKGLFGAQKAQLLELFEHQQVAALELPDEKLVEEYVASKPDWFKEGLKCHHHALFHGSDAYSSSAEAAPEAKAIGHRYTWLKLARPRVEALRQAFLAWDSRLRIAYEREEDGGLRELPQGPDATSDSRPWLRRVTVADGASFFGRGEDGSSRRTVFELSPDLTCILGGSMTGKSTFLDGLRCKVGAELPRNEALAEAVRDRGLKRFLAGDPEVFLDPKGGDPVESDGERWPALFFTQNELQRLASEDEAVEEILARLVPGRGDEIRGYREDLGRLDESLRRDAKRLAQLDEQVAEAEQEKERAEEAGKRLRALKEAGLEDLQEAERETSHLRSGRESAAGFKEQARTLVEAAAGLGVGLERERLASLWQEAGEAEEAPDLTAQAAALSRAAGELAAAARAYHRDLERLEGVAQRRAEDRRRSVERALIEQGSGARELEEFRALADRAKLVDSYRAAYADVEQKRSALQSRFERQLDERREVRQRLRAAFEDVLSQIERDFGGRIRARCREDVVLRDLESFLLGFKRKGVTQWWNGLSPDQRPSPGKLLKALEGDSLAGLGMSEVVAEGFRERMTRANQRELAALPAGDRYDLELRLDDGSYRRLADLSGGQRVSVLLSLLLETHDERPLVIDQPEDELDNQYLFGTVLPALRRIKGRRQVIVATHNANIVVNGDADQVILLEATANAGKIAVAGAIEEPRVRNAIVDTVDGGGAAFRLRQLKYGF